MLFVVIVIKIIEHTMADTNLLDNHITYLDSPMINRKLTYQYYLLPFRQ